MYRHTFQKIALVGTFLFGSQFLAQAQTTTTAQTALTSGVVGLFTGQIAQLNVLNLEEPGATAIGSAASCPVTLEFYGATGALLTKNPQVQEVAPGDTVSISYPAPSGRTEIRAVVITQNAVAASSTAGSTVIPVSPACNIMASLEITDGVAATPSAAAAAAVTPGPTHTFTTDFRAMSPSGVQPLSASSVK
jgi:hypothetical protein